MHWKFSLKGLVEIRLGCATKVILQIETTALYTLAMGAISKIQSWSELKILSINPTSKYFLVWTFPFFRLFKCKFDPRDRKEGSYFVIQSTWISWCWNKVTRRNNQFSFVKKMPCKVNIGWNYHPFSQLKNFPNDKLVF